MKYKQMGRAGGFTLVEVIISMALFGMMAVVFLSVFSSSLIWIYRAGDRGKAYTAAQTQLESRLITKDVEELPGSQDLDIAVGGKTFHIWGGLIQETQTVGKGVSSLEIFAPLVPVISINPTNSTEGTIGSVQLTITGRYTRFSEASTVTVELYDGLGVNRIGNAIIPTIATGSLLSASFYLPANLPSADYVVRVVSTFSGGVVQTARARYSVVRPQYIAGGQGKLWVTANGTQWVDRSDFINYPQWELYPSIPYRINSFAGNGPVVVAVGNSGMVLIGREKQQWQMHLTGAGDLTGITWSPVVGAFFAVNNTGSIFRSADGRFWSHAGVVGGTAPVHHLNGISAVRLVNGEAQTDMLVAVGYNEYFKEVLVGGVLTEVHDYYKGVIVTSTDGITWTAFEPPGGPVNDILRAVTSGNNDSTILIVGDGGTVYASHDGLNFSRTATTGLPSVDLFDVTYAAGMFAVAASDGKVYTSAAGANWSPAVQTAGALRAIAGRADGTIISVGDNGAFALYASSVWTSGSITGSPSLFAVVGY